MKHLEDPQWFICDSNDSNFVGYIDTDSVYVNAEPVLKHLYPNFEELSDNEKDNILEKLAIYYQGVINEDYNRLAKECFNVPNGVIKNHVLEMKTECVIRSAYFRNTRRYAQWITKQEGIAKETLDIKGLEFMKANFPPILGEFFNSILKQVLKGEKYDVILAQIKIFKSQLLEGEIPLEKLGNPTAVKKLAKYTSKKARAGEVFTSIEKGAPAPVRAAIKYNDLLRLWKLDKQHNYITQADKIKWVYLKDNPYKIETLAFMENDIPEKIKGFLNQYIDRKMVFETILLNKLEGFFDDLGWSLNLNPHLDKFASFEI